MGWYGAFVSVKSGRVPDRRKTHREACFFARIRIRVCSLRVNIGTQQIYQGVEVMILATEEATVWVDWR